MSFNPGAAALSIKNLEPLRKILELEHKKGYADSAVIGGLDRFLRSWATQSVELVTSPRQRNRFYELGLINPNYASLNRQQRKQWVRSVLDFLAETQGEERREGKIQSPTVPTKTPPKTRAHSSIPKASIDSPVTVIRGVSSSLAAKFHKLGVNTIRDLLYFFPHRHLDYSQRKYISQLTEGAEETIIANVWQAQQVRLRTIPPNEAEAILRPIDLVGVAGAIR